MNKYATKLRGSLSFLATTIVSILLGQAVCIVMWNVFARIAGDKPLNWHDILTLGLYQFTYVHTTMDAFFVLPLLWMLAIGFYVIGRIVLFLISLWWQAQKS